MEDRNMQFNTLYPGLKPLSTGLFRNHLMQTVYKPMVFYGEVEHTFEEMTVIIDHLMHFSNI